MYFTRISTQTTTGTSFVLIIFGSAGLYLNQLPPLFSVNLPGVPESNVNSIPVADSYTLENPLADSEPAPANISSLSDAETLDCQGAKAWMEEERKLSSALPYVLLRRLQLILEAACPDLLALPFLPEDKDNTVTESKFYPSEALAESKIYTPETESKFYTSNTVAESKIYTSDPESKFYTSGSQAESKIYTPETEGDVTDLSRGGFLSRVRRSLPASSRLSEPNSSWVQAGDSFTILTGLFSLLAVIVYQIAVRTKILHFICSFNFHCFQPPSDITYAVVVTLLVLSMARYLVTSEISVTKGSSSLLTLHAASLASFFKLIKARYCFEII